MPLIDVLKKPVVALYVVWPGLVSARSREESLSGVSLIPNTPLNAAGILIEPPILALTPIVLPQSAISALSPPEELLHERFWLFGLRVWPMMWLMVST